MHYIIPVIAPERFRIVAHACAASFSIKTRFYDTNNIFMSTTRQNYTKPLNVSERTLEIKSMLRWTFLIILPTSGVMTKQRLLLENEIVQYFQK